MNKRLQEMLRQTPNPRWKGGIPCRTCAHKRAAEINADLRAFAAAKRRGHPMPWSALLREHLLPEYKLELNCTSLRNHVTRCLGIKA